MLHICIQLVCSYPCIFFPCTYVYLRKTSGRETHTYMCTRMYILVCECVHKLYLYMYTEYVCIYIYMRYLCIYICIHLHMYICVRLQVGRHTHVVYKHVYVCVYMYTYIYRICVYTYIYKYIHIYVHMYIYVTLWLNVLNSQLYR